MVNGLYVKNQSTGCPWENVGPIALALSDLYAAYKEGLWMEDGSWLDQPAWYTEAMKLYDSEINRQEAQRMKDQSHA